METCAECKKSLRLGDRIFQVARGVYVGGSETPTYDQALPVLAEWHERCAPGLANANVPDPPVCPRCSASIESGEKVVYGANGTKPSEQFIRPESRGHVLPFIVHEACFGIDFEGA